MAVTIRMSPSERVGSVVIYVLLIMLSLVTIVPLMQVVTVSVSSAAYNARFGLHIFPDFSNLTLEGYRTILNDTHVWTAYKNTIVRAFLGWCVSIPLYILGAYPLSKRYLVHRRFWTFILVFTMYFQGGLIPTYMLVKSLGMLNTVWALVIPPAASAFTMIIVRNFFQSIPDELEEAARIDGYGNLAILWRIIVPLSKPIIATISLWVLVFHWNEWFQCMIFISDQSKFVLQLVLRQILLFGQVSNAADMQQDSNVIQNLESMKMATLVVAVLPIIAVYPFLQKYFVKGILIGSVKG